MPLFIAFSGFLKNDKIDFEDMTTLLTSNSLTLHLSHSGLVNVSTRDFIWYSYFQYDLRKLTHACYNLSYKMSWYFRVFLFVLQIHVKKIFVHSVKVRKWDKTRNQLTYTLLFYRGIISYSLCVNKLYRNVGEVLFKA